MPIFFLKSSLGGHLGRPLLLATLYSRTIMMSMPRYEYSCMDSFRLVLEIVSGSYVSSIVRF